MLSHPAVASFNAIIMFLISSGVVGSRNIVEVFKYDQPGSLSVTILTRVTNII